MTDRELLELAAKACGIAIYESSDGTMQNRPILVFTAGGGMGTMPYEERWNPLVDDAQALRLAVKLNMYVHIDFDATHEKTSSAYQYGIQVYESGDPYSATRRAIVRAAADIGRTML